MAELCEPCLSYQDQLLAAGDGSQVDCNHHDIIESVSEMVSSAVQTGKKRKRVGFISTNKFNTEAAKNKATDITKWCDLPLNVIYRVEAVREVPSTKDNDEEFISRVAELKNDVGESTSVWLTSVVVKTLTNIEDFEKRQIYIRSLGLKSNKKGTRKYYNFDIVEY